MAKPFEVVIEQELDATPEQAWEAITTGAGMDGWFMGTNEVEPRLGGALRTALPGFTMESTITAWDPPHRFVNTSPEAPDGRLMAFEFIIEGRAGGTTLLRCVHSGFLPDDVWEGRIRRPQEGRPGLHLQARGVPQVLPWPPGGPGVGMGRAGRGRWGLVGVPCERWASGPTSRSATRSTPSWRGCRRSTASSTIGRPTSLASARTTAIYRFIAAHGQHGHRPPHLSPTSIQPRPRRPGRPGCKASSRRLA